MSRASGWQLVDLAALLWQLAFLWHWDRLCSWFAIGYLAKD
jgi:hypothetical protein